MIDLKFLISISPFMPLYYRIIFINLANDNFDAILSGFQNTGYIMEMLKSKIALFHGFFMTQKPIKNDPANYGKVLREAINNKYRLNDTRVMDPKFLETEEFRNYQNTVKRNMKQLRERYPSYILCIENDFPGIGNGNQSPDHLIYLDCPVWLDTGHLWSSAILNKFDFYTALDMICMQCQVIGVHLNTNRTPINWNLKVLMAIHIRIFQGGMIWIWIRLLVSLKRIIFPTLQLKW